MPRTIYIVLQLLLVLVLLLARNVIGNEIIDPCADPTSPSYNQTQAIRPWHAVASALSMPKGAKAFTFVEKKIECIKLQLDLLSINQALGSIDTTIDIEFHGQLFDTCSTAPAHYLLKIDEKSLISEVLTIPSPEVQQVLMAPLSLKGTYKTAAKNGEFKLQISDMTFESESDPFDQQDYEWHNKIEGTNCTLQGHFKDAQNIVQSTRPMHLALSLPDGRNYVFVMHEGIPASAARAENTVLFENCPCDVKTLAAQNKKEQCNPYNV